MNRKKRAGAVVLLLTAAFAARALLLVIALPISDPLDEMFHAAYAEYISATAKVPGARDNSIPLEEGPVVRMLPRSTGFGGPHPSFREYVDLTQERRSELRRIAFNPPGKRGRFFGPNYESQQPPLMYAIGGAVLRFAPAATNIRLFALRVIAVVFAAFAVPLAWFFFRRLLPASGALGATLAFVAFPGLATFTGRFTNDALALPLAVATLIILVDTARGRLSIRKALVLAALMTAGAWTKIYFLVFLPAALCAALLAPRSRRLATARNAALASILAFALITPWMLHQYRDSGDWLGLTETKAAARTGVGVVQQLEAVPHLFTDANRLIFWRTFVYPGTWSMIGATGIASQTTAWALLLLFAAPQLSGTKVLRRRARGWWGAGIALAFFFLAQIAHAATFAAIHAAAGAEGWYSLIFLPAILTAGMAFGKRAPVWSFIVASALFVAAEAICTKALTAIYSGGARVGTFEVLSRVGLIEAPAATLSILAAAYLAAILFAIAFILRTELKRERGAVGTLSAEGAPDR